MKTLDDAVIEFGGVLPDVSNGCNGAGKFVVMKMPMSRNDKSVGIFFDDEGDLLFTGSADQFQQRAKELGFINGYRWGVEYKTEKVAPEVPDDLFIMAKDVGGHWRSGSERRNWRWDYRDVLAFKITDQRYKPADTSYLEKPALEPAPEEESWYDYDNQKSLRLPPVGSMVLGFVGENFRPFECAFIGIDRAASLVVEKLDGDLYRYKKHQINLKPLDHERKAKAERKRVVDAAFDEAIKAGCVDFSQWLSHLYDKGFLKLPE